MNEKTYSSFSTLDKTVTSGVCCNTYLKGCSHTFLGSNPAHYQNCLLIILQRAQAAEKQNNTTKDFTKTSDDVRKQTSLLLFSIIV